LQEIIHDWFDGRLTNHAVVNGGREILMPVTKGGDRLALIVVRSAAAAFEESRLAMVRAMANHIAVAFENAMLYHIAITDELTGLFSSRHFRQAIAKRYALYHEFGEKMTLLMVDIDNFKKVNDTYGHPAGDAILKDVGRCILSAIRDDDMGFRYGGEEFSVILPRSSIKAGLAVAERMRSLIEHFPFKADQHVLQISVSIGVASWPESAETIKELITEADKALYEAKRRGRNRVVVMTRDDA
jgi:diguanylate cyclase (GGDEF)-like protein